MVPSCVVRELCRSKKKKKKKKKKKGEIVILADSRMDCLRGYLATLSVLIVRIALKEHSKIHEKAYKCIVCLPTL